MPAPTIRSRLERRFVLVTHDVAVVEHLRGALPVGWEMAVATELGALGGFSDLLQYRFILVDLDATAFDPVEIIRAVRGELMLNLAVFCFGGAPPVRDAARLGRADRFFTREEIAEKLPAFCEQFGW
ncbi:MAG: hypothetical protein HY322_08825 [Betaproteobacteria bacterium]|nr:hypothetical protein [Betaproteobacteria bacterium]